MNRTATRRKFGRNVQPTNYRPDFAEYERRKRQWQYEHPQATPEEYCEAMKTTTRELDL